MRTKIEGHFQLSTCRFLLVSLLAVVLPVGSAHAFAHTQSVVVAYDNTQVVHQSVYAELAMASTLMEKRLYPDAIVILNKTVDKDPVNLFAHFDLGFCYLEMAKLAEAKAADQRAVNHKDRFIGYLKKAEYHFQRVQDLNPDFTVSYFKLGKIALMLNDVSQAATYYRLGLEVDPSSAPLAFNLARVYDQSGNVERAISYYQQAIANDPNFVYAYNNLGLIFESQKNMPAAEKAYKTALRFEPSYHFARLNLGNLYATQEKYDQARSQYQQVLRLESSNSWAHLYLGNVHFLTSDFANACKEYQAAIVLNPEFSTAYYLLAIALSKQERFDEALSASLHYMNLEPDGKYAEQLRNLMVSLKLQQSSRP